MLLNYCFDTTFRTNTLVMENSKRSWKVVEFKIFKEYKPCCVNYVTVKS